MVKHGLQDKVCKEERNLTPKWIILGMLNCPETFSLCVCWLEMRETLTQALGMVNEDETIAKHGLACHRQCLRLCCGPAFHGLPPLLAAFSYSGWAGLQARVWLASDQGQILDPAPTQVPLNSP